MSPYGDKEMKVEKAKNKMGYYSANSIINEVKESRVNGDTESEPTAKEVLEYLLGDRDGWSNSDFVVYKYQDRTKRNFIQRFNVIWFFPLFWISAPFQWLFLGRIGASRNSKLGKVIDFLVKFD